VRFTDFEQEDGKQILAYLWKPILKKSSYGVLFYNSKNEVNKAFSSFKKELFYFLFKENIYTRFFDKNFCFLTLFSFFIIFIIYIQVLAVQSHRGYWSAPKGARQIRDNYQLETIKETAVRKFNEEIRVTNRITNEIYPFYDIDQEHHLDRNQYVEYSFDEGKRGDNARRVGLFIIKIDESKLAFDLPDTYENQVILNAYSSYI
jgi:ADP-ribose pyrophosphatase YjhB (NUDIX family)